MWIHIPPLWHCAHLCSSFDLVTNGGIAIALHFERAPFITQEHTLWLPWGRFFVMDTIVMRHEENDIPSCDLSSFTRPSPVVSPAPLTAFAGSCSERRTVVPEIQVTAPLCTPPSSLPCRLWSTWVSSPNDSCHTSGRDLENYSSSTRVLVTLARGSAVILSLWCNWSVELGRFTMCIVLSHCKVMVITSHTVNSLDIFNFSWVGVSYSRLSIQVPLERICF